MFFLQLDDMLDLVKYEEAELRRRAAQELLAESARPPAKHARHLPSLLTRLWSTVRARPDALATAPHT